MQQQRRRSKQQVTLQDRISEWAIGLRQEAKALPPGPDRDQLLRKLRQAETAIHLDDRANSPGLQSPK
jgi:hypothetical protein